MAVAGLLAMLVAGSASIPISTMLKLSSLDQQDLVQLDPAGVRVRVAVPVGFEIDVSEARLTLDLLDKSGKRDKGVFDLSLLRKHAAERSGGLFRGDVPVTVYDLALRPAAVTRFRQAQRFALENEIKEINFGVNFKFAAVPENARSVRFWADLRLRESGSYMTLIDGGEIKFEFEQDED
jgi:hypothetical protein